MKRHKFVESAKVYVAGGQGGNGCASFRREKFVPRGGPDGGGGGDGGCVVVLASVNISSLINALYSPHRKARDGSHGKGHNLRGKTGNDLVIKVPLGTEIWDDSTGVLLGSLTEDGAESIVASGGKGGKGNGSWKRGAAAERAIDEATPGESGEQKTIRLELKIIADVGLVGFPNAGKSSLLRAISNAHPRIAPFPFTTLHPVIGTVRYENYSQLAVVDIPGLIRDAHRGAGLGHRFLRHAERARFLVFVIDMAGTGGRTPAEDYFVLMNELRLYSSELADRPSMIVANKMDIPEAHEHLIEFERLTGRPAVPVSAITGLGVPQFKQILYDAATEDNVTAR